ncbi:hypothetical protein ZWY2020_041247 [Hordeum vulgare]|nr:hypothetical protein ZWY2020_041247 [Hordeum vulgare]
MICFVDLWCYLSATIFFLSSDLDAEIVLQDPLRVQGLLFFFASVILAQVFLVLKKKQFEKVQLYEMNF